MLGEQSKSILNADLVSHILNNPVTFPAELIDRLSLETALTYWNGQMNYHGGDCIMNNLFFYWVNNAPKFDRCEFPDIAMEVFNAFDAGEFYRHDDDKSIDPSEKYTRPLIENILRDRKLIV